MIKRRKTLPALSPKAPAELRPLFAAMMEILEVGEGVRGDKLDRKLTLRDLIDGGVASLRVPGRPEAGITPPDGSLDMSVPPRATGFIADGSFFGMVHLSWDPPFEKYKNHAYTNIYRSETDNFASAEIVGREPGMFYSDRVRDDVTMVDDPLTMPGFYYWIAFTSESNVEGPPNSPDGTYAEPIPDAEYILGQISGQLTESALEQSLREEIEKISAPARIDGSVAQRIAAEAEERAANIRRERDARIQAISDEAESRGQGLRDQNTELTGKIATERDERISAIASGVGEAKDYAETRITQEQTATAEGFDALASQIEGIEAGLGDDYTVGMAIEKQARISGDIALGSRVDTLTAYAEGNAADIVTEKTVRASKDSALASDIAALYVESGDLKSSISSESQARIDGDKALSAVQRVLSAANAVNSASFKVSSEVFVDENTAMALRTEELKVATESAEASIREEMLTLATEGSALAGLVGTIRVDVDGNASAITDEAGARADAISAATEKITTLESDVGISISVIQDSLQTLATEDEALSTRISTTQSEVGDNLAAIQQEAITRTNERDAFAQQITGIVTRVDDNLSSINSETTARVDADLALTETTNQIISLVGDSLAAIQLEATTRADGDTALTNQITQAQSEVDDSLAVIRTEANTQADAISAVAGTVTTLVTEVGDGFAGVEQEINTLVNADIAMAEQISTIQAGIGEDFSSIQQIARVGGQGGNRFTTGWWKHNQYAPTQVVVENGVRYELSGPRTIQRGYDYLGPNDISQTCWFIVAPNDSVSTRHGGWTATFDNVSHEKDLIYSVWVRATNSERGRFFLGLSEHYATQLDGQPASNPYFVIMQPPVIHKWYLAVGVLRSSNFTGGDSGISGLYDPDTGLRIAYGTDYKMKPGVTKQAHQVYQFNAQQGGQLLLASPRFELLTQSTTPQNLMTGKIVKGLGNTVDGLGNTVSNLTALYTVRLDVNGYVSGFGSYNDGTTADFAVLADRFWIASPGRNSTKTKPFMVVNGRTYIDNAFIRDASIQSGKLGPITFGKITDAWGNPVTTVGGQLRANMLDVNSLRVTTANILNGSITNAKIGDAQITTSKIDNLSVSTLKIGDHAVSVPTAATRTGVVSASAYIWMEYPGWIIVSITYVVANRYGKVGAQAAIIQNGTPVFVAGQVFQGDATESLVLSYAFYRPRGNYTFTMGLKKFDNQNVDYMHYLSSSSIVVHGVKK